MDILLITCAILGGLLSAPPRIAATEHVDLIEHNHYFDSGGKKVFDQIVYYNWDPSADRYNVVAWRLLKNENQIPVRHPGNRKYYSSWHDGKPFASFTLPEKWKRGRNTTRRLTSVGFSRKHTAQIYCDST